MHGPFMLTVYVELYVKVMKTVSFLYVAATVFAGR